MVSIMSRVHVGDAELVRCDADFDFTLDAPFVPLRNSDGSWRMLQTTFCEKPYYHVFTGTADNIFADSGTYEMDYNGYTDFSGSGVWIMSAYKFPDGMLAGFCHRELLHPSDPGFGNSFFIGLAVSHDGGNRWRYLGDVAGNVINGHRYLPNMGGCPLLVREGWFHISTITTKLGSAA